MRKTFITKDYDYTLVPGSFSMRELRHFFGGKILNIPDTISMNGLDDYKTLDYPTIPPTVLDNYFLSPPQLANDMSDSEKVDNTRWVFELNAAGLLEEYIYRKLWWDVQSTSPFNAISNSSLLLFKDIDSAVRAYIKINLLRLYELKTVRMYTRYYPLSDGKVVNVPNPDIRLLRYTPVASLLSRELDNGDPKSTTDVDKIAIDDKGKLKYKLSYRQGESSKFYTYFYDFDYVFVRK